MPILGVDIDSTIWDMVSGIREAVLEVAGEALKVADTYTWIQRLDTYGETAVT